MKSPEKILDDAIRDHQPGAIIGLFSGGHDSLTVTHWAATHLGSKLTTVVHIDTGIGVPETQQYVKDVCEQYGWPLEIYRAVENTYADGTPDPMVYEDIVLEHGFPGPSQHRIMYSKLKERQIRKVCRDYRGDGPVMFISGVRRQESSRRMGTVKEVARFGNQVWVSPFIDKSALDLTDYIVENNLPRSPVKDTLHMSGECLCGAFAQKGELEEIRLWYPKVAERIDKIQAKVCEKYPWGWEDGPPKWWLDKREAELAGQSDAFSGDFDHVEGELRQYLCAGCGKAAEGTK